MNLMKPLFALVLCFGFSPYAAYAQSSEADILSALEKTKNLLKNPAMRDAFIAEQGQKTKDADRYAGKVAGSPEVKEEIYVLSAAIFQKLILQSGGDIEKLNKILGDAAKDPAAFASTFDPAERKMLKGIAEKISAAQAQKLPSGRR